MNRPSTRTLSIALAACGLCGVAQADPVLINYGVTSTGQTASASFEFLNASTLQIQLVETTPAGGSALTGGNAILTALGFLLPRVSITGGSVNLAPGTTTAGFSGSELTAGADVSHLWGFTPRTLPEALQTKSLEFVASAAEQSRVAAEQQEIVDARFARAKAQRDAAAQLLANNPDAQMRQDAADLIKAAEQDEAIAGQAMVARNAALAQADAFQARADALTQRAVNAPGFMLLGLLSDPLTPFLNLPGAPFDGLTGGLLGDAAARGGIPIIAGGVGFSLSLSDTLSSGEQQEFLTGLSTRSAVGYGIGDLLAGQPGVTPAVVPEPPTLALAAAVLLALAIRRRHTAANRPTR